MTRDEKRSVLVCISNRVGNTRIQMPSMNDTTGSGGLTWYSVRILGDVQRVVVLGTPLVPVPKDVAAATAQGCVEVVMLGNLTVLPTNLLPTHETDLPQYSAQLLLMPFIVLTNVADPNRLNTLCQRGRYPR